MSRCLLLLACTLALALPRAGADFIFTYFTGNGEDGLHLAASPDGYRWAKVGAGRSFLRPTVGISRLMRDPCVTLGPDGTYHLVWTAGWSENDIGYVSTRDFLHWSPERSLPVMAAEPSVKNTWAPEVTWDPRAKDFLIFWSSTVPARFPVPLTASERGYNHRLYSTTTTDFAHFTPTRLFFNPGFSVIDATFLRTPRGNFLLFKDETIEPPHKWLQLAPAPTLQGPFGPLSVPISPRGLWSEGPTGIQIGADTVIYFDAYRAHHYGALRSRDLVHWEDVTSRMHFPDEGTALRLRHGTVIEVPGALISRLNSALPPPR